MVKKVNPDALVALENALAAIYWYKNDLRTFLERSLGGQYLVGSLNWDGYKRDVARSLVERLSKAEDSTPLIDLMMAVAAFDDFTHLEHLDDGPVKVRAAKQAVGALRHLVSGHAELVAEQELRLKRRQEHQEEMARTTAVKCRVGDLRERYCGLILEPNAQARGYGLEKLLVDLFDTFDLDPKRSFRLTGEQVDGAFTFDGIEYVLEAKWEASPIGSAELDQLAQRLQRKLDNTLGLFLSINGFTEDGVTAHSAGRRLILLMDGGDLMAVLDDRIPLDDLLRRKRRHAAETGGIYWRFGGPG